MPFTPSHAVVALPFAPLAKRRWGRAVPAAIAVGAMTPDLPLFIRGFPMGYGRTHSFAWLPATVLVALGLLLVWRCIVRPAARELSPRWMAARLPVEWDQGAASSLRDTLGVRVVQKPGRPQRWAVSWGAIASLVVALALGIASHIAWDLFTHEGRWGIRTLPVLGERWGPLVGYKWLQHSSSLVGLTILAVWAMVWLRRRRAEASVPRIIPSWIRVAWWISLPAALVLGAIIGYALLGPMGDSIMVEYLAYRSLPPACSVWGVLTIALAAAIQIVRGRLPGAGSTVDPRTAP